MDYILKQYLNKQQVTEQILEKALTSHSWKANHNFYFCFIELSEMDIRYKGNGSACFDIGNGTCISFIEHCCSDNFTAVFSQFVDLGN